jgi:hypothetical protein
MSEVIPVIITVSVLMTHSRVTASLRLPQPDVLNAGRRELPLSKAAFSRDGDALHNPAEGQRRTVP